MNSKSGRIAVAVIIILVAGAVTFSLLKGGSEYEWKAYHSEKYGFSIRYPANLVLSETTESGGYIQIEGPLLQIGIGGIALEGERPDCMGPAGATRVEELSIGKSVVALCKYEQGGQGEGRTTYNLLVPRGDQYQAPTQRNYLLIEARASGSSADQLSSLNLFKKIIGTFGFTPPTAMGEWKTYRNEGYGVEMRYPGEFTLLESPDHSSAAFGGRNLIINVDLDIGGYPSSFNSENDCWKTIWAEMAKIEELTINSGKVLLCGGRDEKSAPDRMIYTITIPHPRSVGVEGSSRFVSFEVHISTKDVGYSVESGKAALEEIAKTIVFY